MALRLRARAATLLIALLCGVTGAWAWTNGAMNGQFSVSSTKKVVFSQGNLKYNGSAYSFATNQYDYIGASQADDNKDLFNWQTATSSISVGGTTGWSVLTNDEWTYLLGRSSSTLRTKATVNSVKGLILMPDGWTAGSVSLTPNTSDFTTNTISTSQWATLEAEGCVFLPAAGKNDGSGVDDVNNECFYWTSTESGGNAYFLICSASEIHATYIRNKGRQLAVRLVRSPRSENYSGGTGTSVNPYLIASTTDWNNLVTKVNGGETYSGTYFKMTANVGTVSTWMTGTFSGTFDGDGKTLTVDYTATSQRCGAFGYLGSASIQNLKVAGTISTAYQAAGGLATWCNEGASAYITNCRVSTIISSSVSGDGTHGGFVAYTDGKLYFTGCVFDGSLTGSTTNACSGFVYNSGWNGAAVSLTDCLFAPSSVTIGTGASATFVRGTAPTITNCYYTQTFGTAQGTQAHTIAAGDYVSTLSVTKGDATATYDVSGITVYSGGIDFNDGSTTTFYGGSGQSVSLALTAATRSGYQFKQYVASQGSLSGETTDTPTLIMPAANSTANDAVTISAEYAPTYNATFADASDASNGWTISPTQQIEGGTVTVSYTGENKVKSVTVTANPSTLAGLKAAINDASDLTDLNTKYLGKYVTATGDIQSSSEGAVGIIAYISKTAVDNSFADSRIFVLATENASNSAAQAPSNAAETTYNNTDLNGYAVTNAWQALDGYNASKAGWNYSASRPDGASHWFVPSYGQWVLGGPSSNTISTVMRNVLEGGSGKFYAVSTGRNTATNDNSYCMDGSWWGMGSIQRIQAIRVRAAFVY